MPETDERPTAPLRLSVLDQSPVPEGASGSEALRNTLDLARLTDSLGYHRYWLAEHHGTPMLASTSPEVLIGPVAAATSRMRVGSGGVILHHYSPRKVAESFSVLSGLLGDRIDLGVGRGMSADATTTFALQRDRRQPAPDDFPDQLAELLAYLDSRPPPDERFAALSALPGLPGRPQPWLLGSSLQSATWAGRHGLPYAFGDFINPEGTEMARLYREFFTESERLSQPWLAVAVTVICAESDEEAERLAASARMCSAAQRDGRSIPVPPVDKALAYMEEHGWPEDPRPRRAVLGAPDSVRAALEGVAREYGAQELIAVTVTHSHEARRRSYELLAQVFGLERAEPSVTA